MFRRVSDYVKPWVKREQDRRRAVAREVQIDVILTLRGMSQHTMFRLMEAAIQSRTDIDPIALQTFANHSSRWADVLERRQADGGTSPSHPHAVLPSAVRSLITQHGDNK